MKLFDLAIASMKYFVATVFMMKFTFYLDKKSIITIFEENFEKYDNCFINFFDGTIVVVCGDVLNFIRESKYKLTKKYCIEDVIWCLKTKIVLCSVCIIELFRKINILHLFKLKW